MTTRRRTATTEANFDSASVNLINSVPVTTLPATSLSYFQAPSNIFNNFHSSAEDFYKKTDTIQHSSNYQNLGNFNNLTRSDGNHSSESYSKPSYNSTFTPSISLVPETSKQTLSNYEFLSLGVNSREENVEILNMASRDRTQEFARIIRSQQGNLVNNAIRQGQNNKAKDFHQYSEFMKRAKLVGRNISSTYAKLEKLTYLAKKRSLFDDSQDKEIQELTGIVRHDLTSLTKQLEDLQSRSNSGLAPSSSSSGHLKKHSAHLVGSLQTKVASITQKFKDVLEIRTENLKKQAERREQYAGGMVNGELPPQAVSGYHQGSVLLADEAAASASHSRNRSLGGEISINMGSEGATGNANEGSLYQQQLHLMEEQDAYLQSRADTMKTIESTIVELGQMFTQLATMVKEQEEIVHRIDSNVDEAEMNVEAAHTELLKYFRSISSNRWLMLKVFGVLIVFFVIFVVFMA